MILMSKSKDGGMPNNNQIPFGKLVRANCFYKTTLLPSTSFMGRCATRDVKVNALFKYQENDIEIENENENDEKGAT